MNIATNAKQPFLVIYDDVFEQDAQAICRKFVLQGNHVRDLAGGALEKVARLFVDADLRDLKTVTALRHVVGEPRREREWAFAVETGPSHRAWAVQANALGATVCLPRQRCVPELARMMSIAVSQLKPSRQAALAAAPGGASIIDAGRELARLFRGIDEHVAIPLGEVSSIGTEVIKGVGAVGVDAWLDSVRQHHEGTFQHCLLVTGTAASYARSHLSGDAASRLTTAALLHDIGKGMVPLHILDKPGRLTEAEQAVMRRHPAAGYDYLAAQPGIDPVILDAVRHHHEALDGSGYPDRLSGDAIKPLTRILTACDIFAALVEARAYKPPMSPQDAVAVLVRMALDGKLDYAAVRNLASVFGMHPPATVEQVRANLALGAASRASVA
jgi:putative nucleotidyltransferase with HDIG domain